MRDPELIIDREAEQERLVGLLARGQPQLVLMYGRRRVGKTHLLGRTWKDIPSFYFTAAETTPAQNREALLAALAEWSGEAVHAQDYPTWRSVFRLLLDFHAPGPLVVTLDEFQYLGENAADLNAVASELNAAWEMKRAPRSLVLVLAGSAVRTLEALNQGGSPLYGRFAWQCRLRPFNYWFTGELAGFAAPRERTYAYSIFGGTPRYLSAIDPERSVAENAISLMLHPAGEVRELVRTALLQEQGLREIQKYVAILRAIGRGRTDLNEIAQAAGLDADTALRDKLERLIELDYVKSARNLGAKSGSGSATAWPTLPSGSSTTSWRRSKACWLRRTRHPYGSGTLPPTSTRTRGWSSKPWSKKRTTACRPTWTCRWFASGDDGRAWTAAASRWRSTLPPC